MKQIPKLLKTALMATLAALAFSGGPLQAAWQLITDFSTETREDFYAWKRFGYGTFYLDGVDATNLSNRALYIDSEQPDENRGNIVFVGITMPDGGVAEGADATLKFDFYAYGSAMHFPVGLSDVPVTFDEGLSLEFGRMLTPNDWPDYETVSRMQTTFDVRDGNQYLISDVGVPVEEWMTIYQYIDNETDTYQIYIKTQADTEPQQLVIGARSSFTFRNGTTDPLVTLLLAGARGTGDATPDPWVVDNIHVDYSGRNAELPDPVGEIKTHALGYPLQSGYIDTANWLGWLYAGTDPFFWSLTFNTWCYVNEAIFSQDTGSWTYLYYGDQRWEDWNILPDGNVDTGNFLQWIYIAEGTDYVYSYTLERWIFMPKPAAGNPGGWAFIAPKSTIPAGVDYPITGTAMAPIIDGIKGEGEWADATAYSLTYDALVTNGKGTSTLDIAAGSPQPGALRAEGTAYMTATAYGLYIGFDITDGDILPNPGFGVAGNAYDGVQVGIDVNPQPSNRTSTVLLDLNPATLVEGSPTNVYARWAITGYDASWGVQASSTLNGTGYFVEVVVPWSFVTSFGVENPLKAGSKFRLTMAVMDFDGTGTQREILWDSGQGTLSIGNAATWPDAYIPEDLQKAPISYSIPKVITAPTIDGTIGEGEWLYASHTAATYANWVTRNGGASKLDVDTASLNPNAARAEGDIYLVATDEALYMGAIITDSSPYITAEFGNASNNMDGVQMALDMNPDPTNRNTAVLWDFTPATLSGGELTGPANIFARWGTAGYDAAWGIQAAGRMTASGYIIEVRMPWKVMQDLGFSNPLNAGSIFSLGFVVVDFAEDGTPNDLITDFGGGAFTVGTASTWNDAVLDD